jgi:hypothetical protein
MLSVTKKVNSSPITLSGIDQIFEIPQDQLGSLNAGNRNQAAFLFTLSGVAASLVFEVDELYSYQDNSGTELIGWAPLTQQSGGTISTIPFTTALPITSFAFGTAADRVRVRVQGSGTLDIFLSTSLVV